MKPSVPIKTDLYRFVTVRTPDHLPQGAKGQHFLYHPGLNTGVLSQLFSLTNNENYNVGKQSSSENFRPVSTYMDLRKIHPELYDFSDLLYKRPNQLKAVLKEEPKHLLLTQPQALEIWNQLFYQVVNPQSGYVRQACIQMIVADHFLKNYLKSGIYDRQASLNVHIVIPKELVAQFKLEKYRHCEGKLMGVNRLGIADFRRVEQEVCCYVPGEVSHIENILAREYKERSTRNLISTESRTETISEMETENLNDVTTTNRNELNSEISHVLNEDRSSNYGGSLGVSATIFGAQINANAYASFATANSSSYSNTSAQLQAQEVTKRALERIVQKTTERRSSRILKEFEENNKHGFDNRNGDKHVTGIYRWVDIIYTNRLVNYGKRLMFEFLVPEPATFYKRILEYKPRVKPEGGNPSPSAPLPPKTLAELKVNKASDITRDNYATLGSAYGVTISPPLEAQKTVSQAFTPTPPLQHNGTSWTQTFNVTVAPDYEADSVSGSYSMEYRAWGTAPDAYLNYNIGGVAGGSGNLRSTTKKTHNGNISGAFGIKHTGQVPVLFGGRQLFVYSASIAVICKLKATKFAEWQTNAYNQLQQAYQSALDAYEAELAQGSEGDLESLGGAHHENDMPPLSKRIIEQRELKRACIEMLTRPFCRPQGKKLYDDLNACDLYQVPQIQLNDELNHYGEQIKFMEQAFDWSIISYLFYPYYWADKCDWGKLMQNADNDAIFKAFLQSSMARVIVPVQPEFVEAVIYYLETGDIWLGGSLVAETEDDLYLSILEDLQTLEPTVEGEWESRVPTSLAIVQNKSAQLDQEGLPCCNAVKSSEFTSSIIGTENVLQIIHP